MNELRIAENDGQTVYKLFRSADCERVNPLEYDETRFLSMQISIIRDFMLLKSKGADEDLINKFAVIEAKKNWQEHLKKISDTELPVALKNLFSAQSKKEQVKLLSGLSITSGEMSKFFYFASTDLGFSYSQYTSEYDPKNFDPKDLPTISYVDKNGINKLGDTLLSDGQLKQAIDHRKKTIAKFLDKGDNWHCLFITYDSIKGKESWNNGQTHFHYISHLFGMTRERVVAELQSRNYSLGSLPHINLTDYGNQTT